MYQNGFTSLIVSLVSIFWPEIGSAHRGRALTCNNQKKKVPYHKRSTTDPGCQNNPHNKASWYIDTTSVNEWKEIFVKKGPFLESLEAPSVNRSETSDFRSPLESGQEATTFLELPWPPLTTTPTLTTTKFNLKEDLSKIYLQWFMTPGSFTTSSDLDKFCRYASSKSLRPSSIHVLSVKRLG